MTTKLTRAEEITHRTYDRIAPQWASDNWTQKFWDASFDKFHQLLPEGRLLEVGCGAGRDAQELIRLGYDYTGTDISLSQIDQARKNNRSATFKHVSLYDLDFSQPFDGFWCAAVLIHIPKARTPEALQTIRRNMRDQAIGFIAMKEGQGERLEARPEYDNSNFLFSYWENGEFKELLSENGYETLYEDYKPVSDRTKWLQYIVKVKQPSPSLR